MPCKMMSQADVKTAAASLRENLLDNSICFELDLSSEYVSKPQIMHSSHFLMRTSGTHRDLQGTDEQVGSIWFLGSARIEPCNTAYMDLTNDGHVSETKPWF